MFKYIKWELFAFYKKNLKWLIAVAVLYGLVLILPPTTDGAMVSLVYLPFGILLILFFLGAFFFGTKKVIDTFRNRTFLLESMIPSSPYKILLAKYIMAIIMNIFCIMMFLIGISIVLFRTLDVNFMIEAFNVILEMDLGTLLMVGINLFVAALSFTALVTLCYIIAKCIMPNRRGSVVVGIIIWYFLNYFISQIFIGIFDNNFFFGYYEFSEFILFNLVSLGLICLYYFITVKLIEDKLEIYH